MTKAIDFNGPILFIMIQTSNSQLSSDVACRMRDEINNRIEILEDSDYES